MKKGGMPTGASPSLDAWDFLKYEGGMPKLEILCLLNSFYTTVSLNLKNFIHTKLNKNSWDKLDKSMYTLIIIYYSKSLKL